MVLIASLTDPLVEAATDVVADLGLWGVFVLMLLESACIPVPSEATMLFAGFNVAGYELDVYWPEHRFAVELDIYETHGTRAAFERDRLRDEELKLAGIEVIRVTGKRLEREPTEVIRRVARLLSDRAQPTGRKPT